jgi:hypothetical protein
LNVFTRRIDWPTLFLGNKKRDPSEH